MNRSGYPDDRNNGALWEGKGFSTAFRLGGEVRAGPVTAALRPEVLYQENRSFPLVVRHLPGISPWAHPWYASMIDYPQRFGDGTFSRVVPGESYIRVDVAGFAAGVSTESLWRGPALRYPIMMSSTAGGFPHLFVGTSRGVDVWIGRLEAEVILGELTESDYFDEDPGNDESLLANWALNLEPRWVPGLHLGLTRSFQYRADEAGSTLDPFLRFFSPADGNRPGNEVASVYARWVFEESGAEVYGEWARDDRFLNFNELLQEPDHSQAYMLGVQKLTPVSDELSLRIHGELVHLQEKGEDRSGSRPMPIFYTNTTVTQGYTYRGQLLGAGVGPGADAQFLAIDALVPRGTFGAYFERVRRNDLAGRALDIRRWSPYEHDTEITGGLRGLLLRGDFRATADIAWSFRYNREFGDDERNWKFAVGGAWLPRLSVSR